MSRHIMSKLFPIRIGIFVSKRIEIWNLDEANDKESELMFTKSAYEIRGKICCANGRVCIGYYEFDYDHDDPPLY